MSDEFLLIDASVRKSFLLRHVEKINSASKNEKKKSSLFMCHSKMLQKSMRELLNITLLYVEDDPDIRDELSMYLERRIKNLLIAKNGAEALEIMEHEKPDLILTDIQMPIMDGMELIRRVKMVGTQLPIIALTAFNASDSRMDEIMELGTSGCLGKPVEVAKLMEMIKSVFTDRVEVL